MKTAIIVSLLAIFAIPAFADDTPIKAEQIRTNDGQYCYRCDYVLKDGWVTKVIQDEEEWKLKPKQALYILPYGMRPESILTQVFRVSPDYGKAPATTPIPSTPPAKDKQGS